MENMKTFLVKEKETGDIFRVYGVSYSIYDEDCYGEPEHKYTNEIQEIDIQPNIENDDCLYFKPRWVKMKDYDIVK